MNLAIPFVRAPDRPEFFGKVDERIDEIVTHNPRKLLELHGAELLPKWQRRRLIPRRPSFLEAFGRVMKVIAGRSDLVSGRVGRPRSDGSFVGPCQQGPEGREDEFGLVRDTGLSIQRVRRVIAAAVRARYLLGPRRGADGRMLRGSSGRTYQRVVEYTDERGKKAYHAHAVVYVVTPLFFERLGLGPRYADERRKAVERRRQRAERFYPGPLLAGRENVRRANARTPPGLGPREQRLEAEARTSGAPATIDALANAERVLGAVMLGLRNKHPDWGRERLRAEAEALIRAGGRR